MKIYDCFTFFNEVELLNFRLDYLCDTVDYFIITEGKATFSGKEKPQNFSLDIIKNEAVKNKIRYYYVDFDDAAYINPPIYQEFEDETKCWQREEYQRDYLSNGLFDADEDDIVIITDIDEIPSKECLNAIKRENHILDSFSVASLEMDHFYSSILNRTQFWYHPKITKFKKINKRFSAIRLSEAEMLVKAAGWHFTSFGGKDRLVTKINSFSHISASKEENVKKILEQIKKENFNTVPYDTTLLPDLIFSNEYVDFFTSKEA
jgi:beta-1,4-mannosyl-glycoprotein beta-1,4-N-acetylglucosaminyltransferase